MIDNLKNIVFSERSQTQKRMYCKIPSDMQVWAKLIYGYRNQKNHCLRERELVVDQKLKTFLGNANMLYLH